ncbi:MAG: adenylate/guanylate cyclase domain-containing protein [Paracoccaceae bacterium]
MTRSPACAACGADPAPGARFCHQCGVALAVSCGGCGAELPQGAKFCPMCGVAAGLPSALPPRAEADALNLSGDAERRQMTILFSDLVGSTPISEALDPEELRDLLSAYRRICADAVERMGGVVTKLIGDGLDAHFGYPVDYEDSAQRAVRAALEIAAAVPGLKARFSGFEVPLAARIGVHTGLVVVGDVGSGALREVQGVIGDTPNVAARLQALAEPGQVVIGQATFRLVSNDFLFRSLGDRALKGVAAPVGCYVVLAEATERAPAVKGVQTALIGREGELAILKQNWRRASGGDGQTVLLTGEAGIGKSRITETLLEDLRENPDFAELRLFASSIHAATAFRPFIKEFARRAGFTDGEDAAARTGKLEALADSLKLDKDIYMPPLAATLSVDLGGRYPHVADPSMVKNRFQAACAALIDQAAGEKTLLLLIEDLHWADPSTLEFINQWITETARRRCLLILTFRPSFDGGWRDESHLSTLNLNRLSRIESRELIARVAIKPLPEEVAATIVQRTDGVPLFIEELTKMVLESELIEETETEYRLSGPLPLLAIPDSLQNSLMARLDRLASVKEVAQIAAAIGRRFRQGLLASVTRAPAAELQAALDRLIDAELMQRYGFPPDVEYEFRHALVQDAAYSSMLKSTRHRVHARIAAVLAEDSRTRALEPEIIARHYLAGGVPVKAAPFSFAAGQRALDASAHREATQHFTEALEHLDEMPDSPARQRLELDIRMANGVPLQTLRGYAHSSVRKNYDRVEVLATGLGATAELMPFYYGMSRYHMLSGDYEKALIGGEKLLKAAETAEDAIFLSAGRRILGSILFYTGRLDEARDYLQGVLGSGLVEQDYSTARQVDVVDFRVAANAYMAWVEFAHGRPNEARAYANRSVELAEGLIHRFSHAFATCFASWTFEFCGDRDRARALAAKGLEISREHGFEFWIGWAEVMLASTGAPHAAGLSPAAYAREGLADWAEVGSRLGLTYLLSLTVELLAKEGDKPGAEEVLDHAEAFIAESGERFWAPEIIRLKGVLRRKSRPAEAEALFRRAMAEADAMGARLLGLRAVLSLAEVPGREEEARRALKKRLLGFAADQDCADLAAARATVGKARSLSA